MLNYLKQKTILIPKPGQLNSLVPQVSQTLSTRFEGYRHLWVIGDLWARIGLESKFYSWFSKNWTNTIQLIMNKWRMGDVHVIRKASYKGGLDNVTTWEDLKLQYDAATTLGAFLIIGALASIRGLSSTCQEKCLRLLESIVGLTSCNVSLLLRPESDNGTVNIQDGHVDMTEFSGMFTRRIQTELRKRHKHFRITS